MKGKIEKAVIIRTKQEYRRPNGMRVKFEDNAVVLVDEEGLPKASEIKGCVAKEVGERFQNSWIGSNSDLRVWSKLIFRC